MTDVILVLTTVSDNSAAEELARVLVEERLAACVTVQAAMTSFYWWQGSIVRDRERQIVVKTTRDRLEALEQRLSALHAYQLPELLVIPVDGGSRGYLDWVRTETTPR